MTAEAAVEYNVYECKIPQCNKRRIQNVGLQKSGDCSGGGNCIDGFIQQELCFIVQVTCNIGVV